MADESNESTEEQKPARGKKKADAPAVKTVGDFLRAKRAAAKD